LLTIAANMGTIISEYYMIQRLFSYRPKTLLEAPVKCITKSHKTLSTLATDTPQTRSEAQNPGASPRYLRLPERIGNLRARASDAVWVCKSRITYVMTTGSPIFAGFNNFHR